MPAPSSVVPIGIPSELLPRHVAIIMDGNGRWAHQRGLPRVAGHREGAKSVRAVVTRTCELGIPWLTLYAFSSQNWARPPQEVEALMSLLIEFCDSERQLILDQRIRVRLVGQRDRIPFTARVAVEALESMTRKHEAMTLQLALSYGGREEIVDAVRRIAAKARDRSIDPGSIDEKTVSDQLWTAGAPDPDLLVRTSGEMRVSNFLLWQIAYAELFVDDALWPDFGRERFDEALRAYSKRDRRFGGLSAGPF